MYGQQLKLDSVLLNTGTSQLFDNSGVIHVQAKLSPKLNYATITGLLIVSMYG